MKRRWAIPEEREEGKKPVRRGQARSLSPISLGKTPEEKG